MKDRWSGVVPACLSVAVLASAISSSHQQEGAVLQGNACTIPPSVSLAATIESSELNVLVLEGKCYLACLELEPSNSRRYQNDTYPAWPYATVPANCNKGRFVHECTRGCSTLARYNATQRGSITSTVTCSSECVDICSNECTGDNNCANPDTLDPWLSRVSCGLYCNEGQCTAGCQVAGTFVDAQPPTIAAPTEGEGSAEHMDLLNPYSIPPGPISPPNLIYLPPTAPEDMPGEYEIDLTGSVPDLERFRVVPEDLSPVAFLFRIEKEGSVLIYIWQYDPTSPLQLTQYICQNLSISLAVVNKMGRSDFTQPLHLTVAGDDRRIPNPPLDLTFDHWEDTRVGYFGHFVLRLTLLGPVDDRYLDNFTLHIQSSNTLSNGNATVVQTLAYAKNETTSTVLKSDLQALQFVMTRSYLFTVTSVGIDGTTSFEKFNFFSNVIESELSFTCQRVWDGNRYFSFELAWSIPPHWASNDTLSGFHLQPYLESTNRPFASITDLSLQNGQDDYTMVVSKDTIPGGGDDFFIPKNSDQYRFDLTVSWIATTHGSIFPRRCYLDSTSPRPTLVRDFAIRKTVEDSTGLTLQLEWRAPADPNGELDGYQICLSTEPLEPDEELILGGPSQCIDVESNSSSLRHTWNILTNLCLYCQMRATNTFVPGNWTEPLLVESASAVSGPCIREQTDSTGTDTDTATTVDSTGTDSTTVAIALATILVLTVVACIICLVIFLRLKRRRKRFLRRVEVRKDKL